MKKSLNVVGFIAALLMFSTLVMKANHLPGAGIVMVLAGFALSVYLPFYLLYKSNDSANNGTNAIAIVGAISASLVNLAITFKFQHWPGASVMLVLGLVSFALIFIPSLLMKKIKEGGSDKKIIMNTFGASGLTLFSLGVLFKIMHWPGASIMMTISVFALFLGYFLIYMFDRSIESEAKTIYLRQAFLSIIIGCVVTSLIMVSLNKPYLPQAPQAVASLEQNNK